MEFPAIRVRNLKKSFRKREGFFKKSRLWALEDVSFEVHQGETYGLLGPNGSGKSSLIRILSTLLTADGGEVRLMGHSLPEEQEIVRWIIGRVSVDAAFYKKLSARENLLYTALLYGQKPGEAERRAMEILEQLGMEKTKVLNTARGDEPRHAAEDQHRQSAGNRSSAVASWTSPQPGSIRRVVVTCSRFLKHCDNGPERRSCSLRTIWPKLNDFVPASDSWRTGNSWPKAPLRH